MTNKEKMRQQFVKEALAAGYDKVSKTYSPDAIFEWLFKESEWLVKEGKR